MQVEPSKLLRGQGDHRGEQPWVSDHGRCGRPFGAHCVFSVLIAVSLSACASVSFERLTATSGTFKSTAWSMTVIQVDFPKGAIMVARENASDSNLANMVVEDVTQIPSWGPLDWLFDIFSIRYASVSGTWGFTGQENQSPQPKP